MALVAAALIVGAGARADAPPRLVFSPEVAAPEGEPLPADASVLLLVTIDATGAVTEVEIAEGLRPDVDALVADAARRMRFTPAERGGAAVPARVRFRYRLRSLRPAGATSPGAGTSTAAQTGRVTGTGTTTATPASPTTATAAVPENPYGEAPRPAVVVPTLVVAAAGRRPVEQTATVRSRYEPGAATRESFRAEELTTVPGTFGEPTRIVATQPGVARTPFGLGYFVVRGASFENTGFFIDGFPVLILYHLAAGPAVISSRLVGQLDFYPGGYPLQYGRFSAGVISLQTRPPPTDRPRAEAEMDVFRASLLGVMPFANGRGSVAVAARRSYYDVLLPLIAPGVSVNFGDAQIRADYRFTPNLRSSLFIFGSSDYFDRTQVTGSGASASSSRDSVSYNFWRAILKLEYHGPHGILAQASAMMGYDSTGLVESDPGRPDRGVSFNGTVLGERASIRIPTSNALTTTIGIDALVYQYAADLAFPSPLGFGGVPAPSANPRIANIHTSITQFGVAAYIEEVLRAGPLEFTTGTRLEYMAYSGKSFVVADPRAVARLRILDGVTVIGATGIFHQAPPFFALIPQVGNPNLRPQHSWQSSVGVEATLPLNFDFRVTGFYNRMWQLARASYQTTDSGGNARRAMALDDGQGLAYGLEVLVRRKLLRGIYGWVSYTLSRSERFILDPQTNQLVGRIVPFTYDQTHILNLAASWDIDTHWRVGTRFQLATGSPTSRVTGGIYDADADGFRCQSMSESDRLPTYTQLDLRVDYIFRAGPIRMTAYVDVLNVYNAPNSEGWIYQYDCMARTARPGVPILPTIGIRGEL